MSDSKFDSPTIKVNKTGPNFTVVKSGKNARRGWARVLALTQTPCVQDTLLINKNVEHRYKVLCLLLNNYKNALLRLGSEFSA